MKNEEREERKRIICHVRQVKWSQKGHIPRSSNKKRDGIVTMLAPLSRAESVCAARDIAEPILLPSQPFL